MSRRVIVTGSREFDSLDIIGQGMLTGLNKRELTTFIHGGARGADTLADQWIDMQMSIGFFIIQKEVYPVQPIDWQTFGKKAGFMRNQYMLDQGADLVLAFYKFGAANKGTQMMVDIAIKAGVEVRRFDA